MAESTVSNPPGNVKTMPNAEPAPQKRNTLKGKRNNVPHPNAGQIEPDFFKLVKAVPKEDWGTRAFIYVYVTEPACDLKQTNNKSYLCRSSAPIELEQLMQDYGSFKGFMTLNRRKPGGETGDLIDRYDFEIYNPKYPPKIPKEAWTKDPRNKRWEALLPPEAPQPQATGSAAEMLQLFLNMQDQFAERYENKENGTSNLDQILNTAEKFAKLSQPAPPTQTQNDLFDTVSKIMNMKADNPMMDVLRDEMRSIREELKEERAENRRLQQEMLKAHMPGTQAEAKTLLQQVRDLGEFKEAFRTVLGAEAGGSIVKSRMSGTLEFLQSIVPQVINSPLANGIGYRLMNPMPPPASQLPPTVTVQPAPPGQMQAPPAPNSQADMMRFIVETMTPAMLSYLEENGEGARFAEWVYAGYPDHLLPLQTIKHPQMPGQSGLPVIVSFYRQPQFWQRIAGPQARKIETDDAGKRTIVPLPPAELSARETAFQKFIEDFCKWSPDQEEPESGTESSATDLEKESEEINV
jgi:hypothetical protein